MSNFAIEVEEGCLEEVTLTSSLGKRMGFHEAGKRRRQHSSQRKQREQRYKVSEMHGFLRSLCVARAYGA